MAAKGGFIVTWEVERVAWWLGGEGRNNCQRLGGGLGCCGHGE